MEDTHYLYKITNLVNGKMYIGVTKDPKHRQNSHFSKGERLVNKAYEKYGKENLVFEVICVGSKAYIYDLEAQAIKLYNSDASKGHGYNICSGGIKGNSGNTGRKHLTKVDDIPYYISGFWFPNKRTALATLGWQEGKFKSRKKAGTLGDVCIVKVRSGPQEPVYVGGFWFFNKKQAMGVLSIPPGVYEYRRKSGTLGDTQQPPRKTNSTALAVPNYFKGFWFPSLYKASEIFGIRPESIRQRILRGNFEESSTKASTKPTRMYEILGEVFDNLEDASQKLNIPAATIKNRVSKKTPGYGYTYIMKEFQIGT